MVKLLAGRILPTGGRGLLTASSNAPLAPQPCRQVCQKGVATRATEGSFAEDLASSSATALGMSLEEAVAAFEAPRDDTPGALGRVQSIPYPDLLEPRGCTRPLILETIEKAYGPQGLGILAITHMPPLYFSLRKRLLYLAEKLARLPEDVKHGLEDPDSTYNFGYSCGRESLEGGQPDNNKVSYYANPTLNAATEDPDLQRRYPSYCRPNIWPTESLPELETAFQQMGKLIVDTGLLLATYLDQYLTMQGMKPAQGRGLHDVMAQSPCHKGRLLHYKPPEQLSNGSRWCGAHTDHGSLTGLLPAMFFRDQAEVSNPDPGSGLYIQDRQRQYSRVLIPPTALAFQMGEASQVHSGGLLQATPHYVQSASHPDALGVSRNTFAVFLQPRWDEPMSMPEHADAAKVGIGQWQPGIDFGQFAELTMQKYYSGSHAAQDSRV